jgi:hypothetical protein
MAQFRIPKQTDRSILGALIKIRDEVKDLLRLEIQIQSFEPVGQTITLPDASPEKAPGIEFILRAESEIMPWLSLRSNNQDALRVRRQHDQIADLVVVANEQQWINALPQDRRAQIVVGLLAAARKYLRAADVEANLAGGSDSEWRRYRDAQQLILNSLEETQRTILAEFAHKALELETASKARLEKKENELKDEYAADRQRLEGEHARKMEELASREGAIGNREKAFNTKEARYVARNEQQKQIDQIKVWLNDWSLTRGTRSKRYVVAASYVLGAIATGIFTVWYSYENIQVLKVAEVDLRSVAWWQWLLLSVRTILPLAACITFIIYFIRWSSEWARQHSDEEFRNRARVLDIGRSAWLLEAVRDAQDNQREIPPELLKELSHNLFAYAPATDASSLHPQAITDLIMQGLASLRVKTADGTEVEAKRGKG